MRRENSLGHRGCWRWKWPGEVKDIPPHAWSLSLWLEEHPHAGLESSVTLKFFFMSYSGVFSQAITQMFLSLPSNQNLDVHPYV